MSEPARIGTCRSATALVRVNRGSTWISFAPFSLAFMGQRNATGWHSAMLEPDRKSTRLNSSHVKISYAVFCLKKKNSIFKYSLEAESHSAKLPGHLS